MSKNSKSGSSVSMEAPPNIAINLIRRVLLNLVSLLGLMGLGSPVTLRPVSVNLPAPPKIIARILTLILVSPEEEASGAECPLSRLEQFPAVVSTFNTADWSWTKSGIGRRGTLELCIKGISTDQRTRHYHKAQTPTILQQANARSLAGGKGNISWLMSAMRHRTTDAVHVSSSIWGSGSGLPV